MKQLKTEYLGLSLRNPLIVSSSGLTASLEKLQRLEAAGAGAVVLKSVFEEQIVNETAHLEVYNAYPEAADYLHFYLKEDYLEKKEQYDAMAEKVIYTGAIDAYFDYKLGTLEYRSVRFENETLDKPNFQGNAAVNYTDVETPWTRIIEHKWFEFGKDEEGNDLPKTVISREYSSEWKPGVEPYYPVNDEKNNALYGKYKVLADGEEKTIFGGRLGEYRYYDMDAVILRALSLAKSEIEGER